MSLINYRLITENVEENVNTESLEFGKASKLEGVRPKDPEHVCGKKDDNNKVILESNTDFILSTNPEAFHKMYNSHNESAEYLEAIIDVLDKFDTMNESVDYVNTILEESINSINNEIGNANMRKNIFLACQTNNTADSLEYDSLESIREAAGKSLWSKLISLIEKVIAAVGNFIKTSFFKMLVAFDHYGRLAYSYEEKLKDVKDVQAIVRMHQWKSDVLFKSTDFASLHNDVSKIIGTAKTEDAMREKVDTYERNKWDEHNIYKFFAEHCMGAKLSGNKQNFMDAVMDKIAGAETNVNVSKNDIHKYIDGLKNIKTQVGSISSKAKLSIVNPQLETILKDAKIEQKKYGKENANSIAYKYYRIRYTVASIAQKVAIDMYSLKIKLLRMYASELSKACKEYINEASKDSTQNESIEFDDKYGYLLN